LGCMIVLLIGAEHTIAAKASQPAQSNRRRPVLLFK
jgi:hypothetical protein